MKKVILGAIVALLAGCYTPMNNSGVATTKPWLEIPGKRVDYDGKQYDSCVQFNLRFWPQEAALRLNLQEACVSACCWRSEHEEIVLDFNKNFKEELSQYGHARKYSPEKITLKVTHSNLVNVTKVTVSPRGAITNSGLVKLDYKEVRDERRLAELARERAAQETRAYQPEGMEPGTESRVVPVKTRMTTARAVPTPAQSGQTLAKVMVQQQAGVQIDHYFYQMNQTFRQKGAIFLLSSRLLVPQEQSNGTYVVTCHAKARTGMDEAHLLPADFPCGVWLVNTWMGTVVPHDKRARQISQAQ